MKYLDDASAWTGFTESVLASLIVSDLRLRHVRIALADAKVLVVKTLESNAKGNAEAEHFKERGNEALKLNQYQVAIDLYTEAIKPDLSNAIYKCNRSAALASLKMYDEAESDAWYAVLLDLKYAKAWSRLGLAMLKKGDSKRAKTAYERAIQLASKDSTTQMREGLASAEEMTESRINAINTEKDLTTKHLLRSNFLDEGYEIIGKTIELHSEVHEQQVDGLLNFAERMLWPYINEVRDYAEEVYSTMRAGGTIGIRLHDWLFGIVLPGRWFAFNIMTALVLCTPSINEKMGIATYYDCGMALPSRTYWRLRTVLGRVLGCLENVTSCCG